jgi:hypothetical protein
MLLTARVRASGADQARGTVGVVASRGDRRESERALADGLPTASHTQDEAVLRSNAS